MCIRDRAICVCRYFKLELSEGTPFTETGAKSITKLGLLFIVVDILSAAFSSAMEKFAFVSEGIEPVSYTHLINSSSNVLSV